MPTPLQVVIPPRARAYELRVVDSESSSPSSRSATTDTSLPPSPSDASRGVYVPVHRRGAPYSSPPTNEATSSSRDTCATAPRIYAPAALLGLAHSPLAAQLAAAPAMRAVSTILGVRRERGRGQGRHKRKASTTSSDSERNTDARAVDGSWRPRCRA
ncbi:hypothetical protein B0H14DRAFT_3481655 [Mycena olivaceomarginata]|nr:hypothetical protein B0H14DRAFT_3481655 [Mycena olivaceomarginata]